MALSGINSGVALLGVISAIAIGTLFVTKQKTRAAVARSWHEGPEWRRLLDIYDRRVARTYREIGCESRLIETRFGPTQTHACGDRTKPPVLLLHGAGSSSLMYGDWLTPTLKDEHFAVSVDFPCDIGRSIPRDSNTASCPQNQSELAEWVKETVMGVGIDPPISMIGYSYGSFICACTAIASSDLVDKIVLIAPASVFAPVEWSWLWRAIVYGMFPARLHNWFFKFMSAEPDFDMQNMTKEDLDLTVAIREVASATGATTLAVHPEHYADDVLRKMAQNHPTLLIVGEEETVINATMTIENAQNAGVKVKVFPRSGHLLLMEYPRNEVNGIVSSFLGTQTAAPVRENDIGT